jgi:hypothetical protein
MPGFSIARSRLGQAHCFVTVTEVSVYNVIQDLRILARRDWPAGPVDQQLESFRLQFFTAFEQWMDGCQVDLVPFMEQATRVVAVNRDLVRWLKRKLEQDAI